MSMNIDFAIRKVSLDENYRPATNTRTTTNFANLARGKMRRRNLRNALKMIDERFNELAFWDNATGKRYGVQLEIISVDIDIESNGSTFPSIEVLKTNILDRKTNKIIEGIVGNNFSSYVRDYDFSILLSQHNQNKTQFSVPKTFGELHGKLFKSFLNAKVYKNCSSKPPVICLSVSDKKVYNQRDNQHPALGIEYQANEPSLTEQYFKKMGMQVRYFMPKGSVAPLAFYFIGDLLNDYTHLELLSTISTMETFQKIYRPEIYNAHAVAGKRYQPNLIQENHSLTNIEYDRKERSLLAIKQGKFAEKYFIKRHKHFLEHWSAS
ncbi:putative oxygenase MesX [Ningiella sp. W23]|uniref:putative oxygenase MesX n=1 Tax=Ningiella sp. W23 TaxID=3023715 RepID=UPI003757C896